MDIGDHGFKEELMPDVLTLTMADGQSIELLSMQTMNEQHVELLPSRTCLDLLGDLSGTLETLVIANAS
jgi:hypothetical protein